MSTPLDQAAILRDLEAAGVRYVVTGSVAASAYAAPARQRLVRAPLRSDLIRECLR